MVEDFDSSGNLRSSVPVQFLATVWSPTNVNFQQRARPGNPFIYKPFFEIDDDHKDGRTRRQVSLPSYCAAVPSLIAPSPAAGVVLDASNGITIDVKAESENGAITRFQYNSPMGMTCGTVDSDGQASCSFNPSSSQQGQVFNFCFMADDAAGLSTERRCVSLSVGSSVPTSPPVVLPMVLAPAENATVSISTTGTIVTCRGMSTNGPIAQFKQSLPAAPITGMSCGNIVNNELSCNFTPSATQFGTSIRYCFTAVDSVGAESDTRCFSMQLQGRPTIISPAAGSTISVPIGGWSGLVQATSPNGPIVGFSGQLSGMSCSSVTNGTTTCTFSPSSSQLGTSESFCFSFVDSVGESTENRCITLQIATPPPVILAPAANSTLSISTTGTIVTCRGMSTNGPIVQFKQTLPANPIPEMSCGNIVNDEVICNFTPTTAQLGTSIQYCFTAIDSVGAESESRCFSMKVQAAPTVIVTEIFTMIKHAIPSMQGKFLNYGCTGTGHMDFQAKNLGKPVDDVDKALNARKRCIRCIKWGGSKYTDYEFNNLQNRCGTFSSLISD